ncbi:MAG: hypothetical protein ACRC41_00555 [Sarcina sp.]
MIEVLLEEYKNLSIAILAELDKERFEKLESLLEKKDEIQEKVKGLNIDSERLKGLFKNFETIELDEKIIEKMTSKKSAVKEKIKEVSKRRQASNVYANAQNKIQFLNMKL